ncbi:RNA polymerase sigma factor, partial [Mariniblastus sp.]|nr:RNA polymerase sigma factor [Mariniblastus sp.]
LPRGKDETFCEDVAQESLLKILKSLDSFEGRSKFTTWAISISIRTGISQLRRKHFKDVSLDAISAGGDMSFDVADVAAGDPQQEAVKKSMLSTLSGLINTELTDKQRVVVRSLLGGMPVEEIAERTGSNRNAVYKMFHDARKRLKSGFESAGYSADEVLAVFS